MVLVRTTRVKSRISLLLDKAINFTTNAVNATRTYLTFFTLAVGIYIVNSDVLPLDIKNTFYAATYNVYSITTSVLDRCYAAISDLSLLVIEHFEQKPSNNTYDVSMVKRLKALQQQHSIIEAENLMLKESINFVDNIKYKYLTTRISQITHHNGRRAVVLSAGQNDGVRIGNIVMNTNGIVGRITKTNDTFSIVTLIGEDSIRFAAMILPSQKKCIVGSSIKNTNYNNKASVIVLTINYLSDMSGIHDDDVVITSGEDGITPYSIKIGIIKFKDNMATIQLEQNFFESPFVQIILDNINVLD